MLPKMPVKYFLPKTMLRGPHPVDFSPLVQSALKWLSFLAGHVNQEDLVYSESFIESTTIVRHTQEPIYKVHANHYNLSWLIISMCLFLSRILLTNRGANPSGGRYLRRRIGDGIGRAPSDHRFHHLILSPLPPVFPLSLHRNCHWLYPIPVFVLHQ